MTSFDRHCIENDPHIIEAFQYWSEALAEADTLLHSDSSTASSSTSSSTTRANISTSASMCGINNNNNFDIKKNSNNSVNSKDNSKNFNLTGYDNEVINLSNHGSSNKHDHNDRNSCSVSSRNDLLKEDIQFMIAYVSILCNYAEIYEVSGNLSKSEQYISFALKVIQQYNDYRDQMIDSRKKKEKKGNCNENNNNNNNRIESNVVDRTSKSNLYSSGTNSNVDNDDDVDLNTAHYPILGRVLGLAAMRELSVGQIITAEGTTVLLICIHVCMYSCMYVCKNLVMIRSERNLYSIYNDDENDNEDGDDYNDHDDADDGTYCLLFFI